MNRKDDSMKTITLLISLLAMLFVGCSSSEKNIITNQAPFSINEDEMFRFALYIDRVVYREDEEIDFYTSFEYVGKNKEISIRHGDPLVIYTITDDMNFNTRGISNVQTNNKTYGV